ncbi:MAG TPA: ABC transporter ATP-binding protein [Gemmataceae bacterium]|nr:ABC transporter ATP-binding protein [Gemmataceae bacterium]
MSDFAIRTWNLRKVYRLYTRPHYRVLDVLGLLRRREGAYTEHVALTDVNLEIRRGEKVAVIGRNGAGKSTLLKLVTRVTEPTAGRIEVRGQTHALLQIGTGFHPDFTGRENALSYLAHLGVTGWEAERRLRQIVEFAELEEYIDQPVKTYSTGMAARLMFATSTAISPDILVLDEVLGVGDAYFARKSYERIRELCDGHGTTVLLVSHDVYSASQLCERMIWIDRGRVLMDADSPTVVTAYEDSIREQEERRLRKKRLDSLRAACGGSRNTSVEPVLIEIRAQDNRPQPCPVYFSRISLLVDGRPIDSLPLGTDTATESSSRLETEATCWGEPVFWEGRQARPMLNYGSPFHKVAGVFTVPAADSAGPMPEYAVAVDYWSAVPCRLHLRLYHNESVLDLGPLPPSSGRWQKYIARPQQPSAGPALSAVRADINSTGQHGSGAIAVTSVWCVNADGREAHFFNHGEPIEFHVAYRINKPDLCEHSQVLIALHRDGVRDVCRFITRDLLFDASQRPIGTICARLPRLPLAEGTYTVTVMVAEEGYYDRDQTLFYSINPGVYACLVRVLEIVVQKGGPVGSGTGVVIEADWTWADCTPAELVPHGELANDPS